MTKILTRQKMGAGAIAFHWTMMVFTCGIWVPVYLSARRKLSSVTYINDPAPAGQQQQYAPPPQWAGQPQQAPYPPQGQYPPQQYGQPGPPQHYPPQQWQQPPNR